MQIKAVTDGDSLILKTERRSTGRTGRFLEYSRKLPNKNELVFLDDSPDYCIVDESKGVRGTQNRECGQKCEK